MTTVGAGVLVACGGGGDAQESSASGPVETAAGSPTSGTGDAEAAGAGPAEATVPLADVPVGQAVVVSALGARFVVAQPTAGEVVAFSASCTHAGTTVEAVGGLELRCPNHGSQFDAGDGSVSTGPATTALPAVDAVVDGDSIVLTV